MSAITDQLGRKVSLAHYPPKRIVSLVPSQTELLYHLGLSQHVVGRTKFCIHPDAEVKSTFKVGGTKNVNIKALLSLKPDIVLANKEENTAEMIFELEKKVPVYVSDVHNLTTALEMIHQIGQLTGAVSNAHELVNRISKTFMVLDSTPKPSFKAVYVIWKNPWMSVGGDTFISDIMFRGGFTNCFRQHTRYPEFSLADLSDLNPDALFLSSEPYPFKEKDKKDLENLTKNCLISIVDGEVFSWYGSKMLKTPEYLLQLNDHLSGILSGKEL